MELLKLSKFKLQLRNLITEFGEVKVSLNIINPSSSSSSSSSSFSLKVSLSAFLEKERYASEQLYVLDQKQKETESELTRRLTKLQAELAASNELRQKLETKVNYLQNDNALVENKQKELQGTINRLLQSRESFAKVYEDSTCEMKLAIEYKDRKIAVLSEKINAHLSLFASVEKEAFFVKKVVDNVHNVLSEKEEVVAGLKIKVDKVATLGVEFVEKISKLESKLRSNEDELRRKEKIILELEAQPEAANNSDKGQSQVEELQETLLAKEAIIKSLISEKKALHFELGSLQIIIKKVQDTVEHMNEESRRAFSSMLASQECATDDNKGNHRTEDASTNTRENSPHESFLVGVAEVSALILCQQSHDYDLIRKPLKDSNIYDSCVSESTCSEPQSAANVLGMFGAEAKQIAYHARQLGCAKFCSFISDALPRHQWHLMVFRYYILVQRLRNYLVELGSI